MKKLKFFLASSIASFFLMLGSAAAMTPANGWMVNISSPANTTSKTFNVQYTTLSVNSSDKITVQLFQNGQSIGSQTTSEANGDSGAFKVTVSEVGDYSYYIKATNTGSPTSKTTSSVNVKVANTPVKTNTINTGSTANNATAETASSTSSQESGANGSSTDSDSNGTASSSDSSSDSGNVGDKPASTEDKNDEEVLSETAGDSNTPAIVFGAIAGLAALGGIGYAGYRMMITRRG